jgi:hypothetical protein
MRCQRQNDLARELASRALDRGVTVSPMAAVVALTTASAIVGMEGDVQGAVDMVLAARAELRAGGGHQVAEAWMTGNAAAWATYDDGRPELARSLVAEALELAEATESSALMAACFFVRGNLLVGEDPIDALTCFEKCVELTNMQSNSSTLGLALACAGRLWHLTGDTDRALGRAIESIQFLREDSDQSGYVGALALASATLVELGSPEYAAEVLGVYEGALADHLGGGFARLALVDGLPLADCVQEALGDERFAAAFAQGRSMSLDDVADRVLAALRQELAERDDLVSPPAAP